MTIVIPGNSVDLTVNWIAWGFVTFLCGGIFFGNIKDYKNPWLYVCGSGFFFLIFLAVNSFTQWIILG